MNDRSLLSPQDKLDGLALFDPEVGSVLVHLSMGHPQDHHAGSVSELARHFDKVDLSLVQVYAMGGVQVALCLLAALGLFRVFSYSALGIMHFFTVMRRWERFLDPFAVNAKGFPINRNPVIDLAVLAAFIALVLLIRRDHFSIGGWLSRHDRARWWSRHLYSSNSAPLR